MFSLPGRFFAAVKAATSIKFSEFFNSSIYYNARRKVGQNICLKNSRAGKFKREGQVITLLPIDPNTSQSAFFFYYLTEFQKQFPQI